MVIHFDPTGDPIEDRHGPCSFKEVQNHGIVLPDGETLMFKKGRIYLTDFTPVVRRCKFVVTFAAHEYVVDEDNEILIPIVGGQVWNLSSMCVERPPTNIVGCEHDFNWSCNVA